MGNSDQNHKEESVFQNNSQQFTEHISGLFENAIHQQKAALEREANRLFSIIEKLEAENNQLHDQIKNSEQAYQDRLQQIRFTIDEMFSGNISSAPQHINKENVVQPPVNIQQNINNQPIPQFNKEKNIPLTCSSISTVIELKPRKKKLRRIKTNRVPVLDTNKLSWKSWTTNALATCVIAALLFGAWQVFISPYLQYRNSSSPQKQGQVAGASTQKNVTPNQNDTGEALNNQYPESFAQISYDQTVWDTVTDSEFGISMKYPKNATNRVRILGGSNLWFLRFNGYFMKFTKIETKLSLDAWWENNKIDYAEGNIIGENAKFKNEPAIKMQASETTSTSGTTYFIKKGEYILQIWVKDEDPNSDDGKRLATMLDSLQISQPK